MRNYGDYGYTCNPHDACYRVHFATRGFPALSMGKTFAVYIVWKEEKKRFEKDWDTSYLDSVSFELVLTRF